MADVYTTSASVSYVQAAYERMLYLALRPEMFFDQIADVKPTKQSAPGNTVTFFIQNDLAAASTPINESVDVSAQALSNGSVVVTLYEYGAAAITTAFLRGTSLIEVDPAVANAVGFNAGISIDNVIRDVLFGGTNVDYSGWSGDQANTPAGRSTIIPTNIIEAKDCRLEVARLRGQNVQSFNGLYAAFIHPDVSFDLQGATDLSSWRAPHIYSQPQEIWQGEIGAFQGSRFVETPRCKVWADAGSSTTNTDVYGTIFLGRQSLAKAYSNQDGNGDLPKIIPGPITDHLRRFKPMGWYWLGGYSVFRQPALRRVESASSIGSNAVVGSDQATINA